MKKVFKFAIAAAAIALAAKVVKDILAADAQDKAEEVVDIDKQDENKVSE